MTRTKVYQFRNGNVFTYNRDIIAAIGEADHVRQLSVVVAASSKPKALEYLNAVGIGISERAVNLVLADSPRVTKWVEEGILTDGSVIASSLLARKGSAVVSLTPTACNHTPVIQQVSTF